MFGSQRLDRLDHELRHEDGVRQRFRIAQLVRVVDAGPIAVAHCSHGRFRERLTLWLDPGGVLRLRLFWPCPQTVAALTRISWDDEIGWAVGVRLTDGRSTVVYAWDARVDPAPAGGFTRIRGN
jgi:hypothetical protein